MANDHTHLAAIDVLHVSAAVTYAWIQYKYFCLQIVCRLFCNRVIFNHGYRLLGG